MKSWEFEYPHGKQRKDFNRLAYLFPDTFAGTLDGLQKRKLAEIEKIIDEKLIQAKMDHDYRNVPQIVFVQEPYRSRYYTQIIKHFRAMCRELASYDLDALFGSAALLDDDLKVPYRVTVIPEFKQALDEVRLQVVLEMTDMDFLAYFGNEARRMSIGHTKYHQATVISDFLRGTIKARFEKIVNRHGKRIGFKKKVDAKGDKPRE